MYHKLLRIGALTLALVLLFDSGIFSPITHELSSDTGKYLANAIGMYAAVPSTEINTLSEQLLDRERQLQEREISVSLKESKNEGVGSVSTFILSVALFVLLVLIVLNYLLDYVRNRQEKLLKAYEQTA